MSRIAISLGLCGLMLWVFTQLSLRGDTLFYRALQNSGHGCAFFLLTLTVLVLLRFKQAQGCQQVLAVSALMFVLGVGIETIQHFIGRQFSASDLVMNSAGIISACALYLLYSQGVSGIRGIALMLLALLPMFWVVHKPARYAVAKITQNSLPSLYDFESFLSSVKLFSRDSTIKTADYQQIWTSNLSRSLRVVFFPGRYPGVVFVEPAARWCVFKALSFDAYSENPDSTKIYIRVDDPGIDYQGHSFMTVTRLIHPGRNVVSVPFYELQQDAQNRGVATFEHITSFQFFILDNKDPIDLYFDNIKLNGRDNQATGC